MMFLIGTRASPLALAQANQVRARLEEAGFAASLVPMRTTGDLLLDQPLADVGGKGLFTKELDQALLKGDIHLAVHSAKDLPTQLPQGLALSACLEREDVRDALITRHGAGLESIPYGGVLGTASLRRAAQMRRLRPDLTIKLLCGNVQTRLKKVEDGLFDATLLALAGLKRLRLEHHASFVFDTSDVLPAVGQGAIAIVSRREDAPVNAALGRITHYETEQALAAERAFLHVLDGSCRTPIAGYAYSQESTLFFHGLLLEEDGSRVFEAKTSGPSEQAPQIGAEAGHIIKAALTSC